MTVTVICPSRDGRFGRACRALVLVLAALAPIAPARAAPRGNPCPLGAVRWDESTHVLEVSGKVRCTLEALAAAGTGAPLTRVDRPGKVWFLGADLLLENGAELVLHGGSGDVNELRLRSNNTSDPNSFATISGDWGTIESHRNSIRRNQIRGNDVGVRVSVGSTDNVLESNQIADSRSEGMYFYQGSDAPIEGDGHPRRNRVTANSFTGNAGWAIGLTDADDNVFEGNTYSGNGGVFHLVRSSGNTIDGPETSTAAPDGPGPGSSPSATPSSRAP
jgi:parallel beta-helix repeat protein